MFSGIENSLAAAGLKDVLSKGVKAAIIKAPEKALADVVLNAYHKAFIEGVKKHQVSQQLEKAKTDSLPGFAKNFKVDTFDLQQFDLVNIYENPIVQNFVMPYNWLMAQSQLSEHKKNNVNFYIKEYFAIHFIEQLEQNPIKNEKLIAFFNSPAFKLRQTQFNLEKYRTKLQNRYHEITLDDEQGMRLSDVYIEPEFNIHKACFKKGDERIKYQHDSDTENPEEIKNAFATSLYSKMSLHRYIFHLIQNQNPFDLEKENPKIILIYGFPGQGKSSFCKRLLNDVFDRTSLNHQKIDKDLYFLTFRSFNTPKIRRELFDDPFNTLLNFLKNREKIGGLTAEKLGKSVLLLDGLDELQMSSGIDKNSIDDFVKNLYEAIEPYPEMKIIITSRYGYLKMGRIEQKNIQILQIKEMDLPKQQEWLSKYKGFHPDCWMTHKELEEYNEKEKFKHIKELITQPILLHMIATLSERIDETANRSVIYKQLFNDLISRKWAKQEGQIKLLENLTKSNLRSILQEFAFAIHLSDNEYINKSTAKEICDKQEFLKDVGPEEFNDVLKGIMVSFYLQEVNKDKSENEKHEENDYQYAIEFLHKSLQEYLTAEYIVEKLKDFTDYNDRKKKYAINSWEEGLQLLNELFAVKRFSTEIEEYIGEVIEQETEKTKTTLIERLTYFSEDFFKRDFLWEFKANSKKNNFQPIQQIRNIFRSFWWVLGILINSNKPTYLQEYLKNYIIRKKLLYLLQINNKNSHLNLEGANFSLFDISNINLQKVNLKFANLERTTLDNSDLRLANLSYAKLQGAKLNKTDLGNTLLFEANLENASLRHANLKKAFVGSANLSFADLSHAHLNKTNLQNSNLSNSHLVYSVIINTNFTKSDLSFVYAKKAYLRGSNLSDTNLSNADFSSANFNKVKLKNADLSNTDLSLTTGLSQKQLSQAKTLYNCIGIPSKIEKKLKEEFPHLFDNPDKRKKETDS